MDERASVHIGPPRDRGETECFAAILTESFGSPPLSEVDWLARYDLTDFRLARLDGQVAGGGVLLPLAQWFGGKSVPMLGVHCVAVAPEYRGTGVGSALMRALVEEIHSRKVPISTLYPSTQPVYRAVGYEQAGIWVRYRVPISGFRLRDRELAVERVRWEDLDDVRRVYDERARRESGNLDRTEWCWRRIFEPMRGSAYVFRARRGKTTEGYIAFARKWHPDHLQGHDIHCLDFVALTPEAGRRLLTLMADHRSLGRDMLVAGPPSAPALLPLSEQIGTVDTLLRWMVRIIWVKAALEARGYPRGLTAELGLEIEDDVLTNNTGGYILRVGLGAGRVERGRPPKPLWLHVRGLAALYTGYATAEQLSAIGLARGDADTLALATEMFSGPAPWLPEMF